VISKSTYVQHVLTGVQHNPTKKGKKEIKKKIYIY
jgi:hypothetical protein